MKIFSLVFLFFATCYAFSLNLNIYYNDPLILTGFIENGNINFAKLLSRVTLKNFLDVESYAGFITVDKQNNGNLFFWFFKSEKANAPVAVWLQGGPGGSSLVGLFHENGPLEIMTDMTLARREYSWTTDFHMLYIDNPVGAGFSFADPNGYTSELSHITKHLYVFLEQFYKMFGEVKNNDLYLTGESYACKYIADLAHKIHEAGNPFNLKGLVIGGGFCDPQTQSKYGTFLYSKGLINATVYKQFLINENLMDQAMNEGDYLQGYVMWNALNRQAAKRVNTYNYKAPVGKFDVKHATIMNTTEMRRAAKLGNAKFYETFYVFHDHLEDFMKSVKPLFPTLMQHYKVLLYAGELDVIAAAPLMEKFVDSIEWKHRTEYLNTTYMPFVLDGRIIAYSKNVNNFTFARILDAGHLTPHDKPIETYALLLHFLND